MKRKLYTSSCLASLLICAYCISAAERNPFPELFPKSTQVITIRNYGTPLENQSDHTALSVDSDGRVGVSWIKTRGGKPAIMSSEVVGEVATLSDLLKHKIAKAEVPFRYTRLTDNKSGVRFHVVVAAFLSETPKRNASHKLYLFAERGASVALVLSKVYDQISTVLLDDLNGDKQPELAAGWVDDTGKVGDLDLWSISPEGQLARLEFPSDEKYLPGMRTYFRSLEEEYFGPGQYSIISRASLLNGGEPVERRVRFEWNPKAKQYRIVSVVEVKEIKTELPLE